MSSAEVREDEVDRIIAAWGRARPDLDVSPLAVLSRVSTADGPLSQAASSAIATPAATQKIPLATLISTLPRNPQDSLATS